MGVFQYIKSKEFLLTLISIIAITVLILFGLGRWMNSYTHHDEKIKVPNLEKLSLDETEKSLSEANLNFVVIDSASFNPDYPPKSVIEQNPEAGDFVKKNRKIYLTLNPSNYRDIKVPEIIRTPTRQAISHLKSAGFKIGKKKYVKGEWKGLVKGLEYRNKKLQPGDILPKNSVIDIIIWDEKPVEKKSDSITEIENLPNE
ncbi:MAG: PASTA domain-containing protein [Bacteroidota bacterium]